MWTFLYLDWLLYYFKWQSNFEIIWTVLQLLLSIQYWLDWTTIFYFSHRQTVISSMLPLLFTFSFSRMFLLQPHLSVDEYFNNTIISCFFSAIGHYNKLAKYWECATEDKANQTLWQTLFIASEYKITNTKLCEWISFSLLVLFLAFTVLWVHQTDRRHQFIFMAFYFELFASVLCLALYVKQTIQLKFMVKLTNDTHWIFIC